MPKQSNKCNSVVDYLKNKITSGTFPIYSKLPSENELCEELNVSRVTIRRAIDILKNEGLIESHQGSGSFVSANNIKTIIPVILSSDSDTFRSNEIYQGIFDFFSKTGFSPLMLITNDSSAKEREIVSKYFNSGFTNMLIIPLSSTDNTLFYHSLMQKKANFVFLDKPLDKIDCNCVASSNFTGGYLATKHLIELGHRRIAFFSNVPIKGVISAAERFNGYKYALAEYGIEYDKRLMFEKKDQSIRDFAEKSLKSCEDVTAIFCSSDGIALSTSNLIFNEGKKIAVIGFDNLSLCETSIPSISSVDQNFYQIGHTAAEMLYERILNPNLPFEKKYISVTLIPRSTTLDNYL